MKRAILAILAGLAIWAIVATLLNLLARIAMPGYREAELAMEFTTAMQCARLALAAVAGVASGYAAARIASGHNRISPFLGVLLMALFIPVHIGLWDKFPIWYHLIFLGTLVPLPVLGERLWRRAGIGR